MIRKTIKPLLNLISLISMAALSSCTHSFYAPNDNIMVQLKEKNDINITAGTSAQSTGFQGGYSPIKHLSVAGSYFSLRDDNSNNGNNNFQDGRFNLWKAALGTYYFINLGDLKYKQKETKAERVYSMIEPIGLLFDLYAGYGEGVVENNYNTGSQSLLDHQQYFIQGGFHFVCSFIDVGISVRKSTLNYYNGRILGQIENINLIDIEELLEGNRYNPTEISFKVAGGWKYGKIFVHYNMAPNLNPRLLSDGPNGSVGFQLHLNEVIQGIKKLK